MSLLKPDHKPMPSDAHILKSKAALQGGVTQRKATGS